MVSDAAHRSGAEPCLLRVDAIRHALGISIDRTGRSSSNQLRTGAMPHTVRCMGACSKCGGYDHNIRTCTTLSGSVACHSCGSTEVWDEGDTVYCTPCSTRTWVATGDQALRVCPDCGDMSDAKSAYCSVCNSWIADRP